MPVWLMPFELYRLTIVTFRQCTKFCFFSKHKLSNSTWWLLVPPDVIFQMIKCITVFSGVCNAPGSCFSLLLTQWTACLSCFMFFGMSSGLSVDFIIPALWLLQYFVLAFFFFKCRAYLFLPSAVTRARVIWSEFDLKPWMNVKEIRIGARRWDRISKKRREKPNATLTAAYWASKLWSQLLQFNHHFKCEIEEENIN